MRDPALAIGPRLKYMTHRKLGNAIVASYTEVSSVNHPPDEVVPSLCFAEKDADRGRR